MSSTVSVERCICFWSFLCAAEFDVFKVKFRARFLKSGLNQLQLRLCQEVKLRNRVFVNPKLEYSVVQITRYMFIQTNQGDMLPRQDFVCYRFFRWKAEDSDEPLNLNDILIFWRFSVPNKLPLEFILRV